MAFPQRKRTPSFSSSILDSIYRSIDESDGLQTDLRGSINVNYENVSSSSSLSSPSPFSSSQPPKQKDEKLTTLRRAIMDDKHWLYTRSSPTTTNNSSSNSSDSSAFSSSEAESYREHRRSRKLVRQGNILGDVRQRTEGTSVLDNDRLSSKFQVDKKLQTVKILDELKNPRQPMSPGARLTSFLNFILKSNARKVKLCSVSGKTTDVKSSSSRSCFSRTRHNTRNINCNHLKRSVRFYPLGDRKDNVHKDITREKNPIPDLSAKKNIERVTSLKEEIKTKIHQTELTFSSKRIGLMDSRASYRDEGEDEESDVWSHSSSDLFELDNYSIRMGRYIKELPVYETTDFKTNQTIARGLLL